MGHSSGCMCQVYSYFCASALVCRESCVAARHHNIVQQQPGDKWVRKSPAEFVTVMALPLQRELQTSEGRADGL